MEHMKRMLVVAVAVVLAGAGLMYVHKNMYKNCGDNVKVQQYLYPIESGASPSSQAAQQSGMAKNPFYQGYRPKPQ